MKQVIKVMVVGLLFVTGFMVTQGAETQWTNLSGGNWSDAANWSAGLPLNMDANFTHTGASYDVIVDQTPADVVNSLTLINSVGYLTRLLISAPEFVNSDGVVSITRSEVSLASGSTWYHLGKDEGNRVVDIQQGGSLLINGGTMLCTNLVAGAGAFVVGSSGSDAYMGVNSGTFKMNSGSASFDSMFIVGHGSKVKGEFEVTGSGVVDFTGVRPATLNVGNGGGSGIVRIKDSGTMYVGGITTSQNLITLGSAGVGSHGKLELSGTAQLTVPAEQSFPKYFLVAGGGNATGIVSIAGDAVLSLPAAPNYAAHAVGSYAEINVEDNGVYELPGAGSFHLGSYYNTSGSAYLNIRDNGFFSAGSTFFMCLAGDATTGYSEINLEGGELAATNSPGPYGLYVARMTEAGKGKSTARLNVSGGFLNTMASNGYYNHNNGVRGGISVGHVIGNNTSGGTAYGELNLSSGAITNWGAFTVGHGEGGTGIFNQSGGSFRQGTAGNSTTRIPVIGFGGGYGEYNICGGEAEINDPFYVGGLAPEHAPGINGGDGGKHFTVEKHSEGVLRVDDGRFEIINNKTLWCGSQGEGTIIIGSNGLCQAANIVLDNNTQSTLRFELGSTGEGLLKATDTLTINEGAKLEVDATGYKGGEVRIQLVSFANCVGSFASEDITVTGNGRVYQDQNGIWLHRLIGTKIILK